MDRITISIQEAADYIGVHKDTIRRLARENKIPHIRARKRILFRKDTLDQWMFQQEEQAYHVLQKA